MAAIIASGVGQRRSNGAIWLIEGELMVECGEQQGREEEFGQKNRGRKIRRGMNGTVRAAA